VSCGRAFFGGSRTLLDPVIAIAVAQPCGFARVRTISDAFGAVRS